MTGKKERERSLWEKNIVTGLGYKKNLRLLLHEEKMCVCFLCLFLFILF